MISMLVITNPRALAWKVTSSRILGNNLLQYKLYIRYLIKFVKSHSETLIDSGTEVNAITLTFATGLRLIISITNVGVPKIDDSFLKIYSMISTMFSL